MTLDNIRSDTYFLLFGTSTPSADYPDADLVRNVNTHFDNTVSLILQNDARWKWDDDNQTDHPIGLIDLVNEQQDYELAGGTYLKVNRVEAKDAQGKYYLLHPIDEKEVQDQALTEFGGDAGRPRFYDKMGEYIFLYPKPSSSMVTLSEGLKVYYQRLPSYFETDDTTKTPGFAPLYHRILSSGAALDYAVANEMNGKINILTPMLTSLQSGLIQHYATRAGDERTRMTMRKENYGEDDRGFATSDKTAF